MGQGFTVSDWNKADSALAVMGLTLLTDTNAENRETAVGEIKSTLQEILSNPASFSFKFNKANFISVLYPPDSSFRLLSAQHFVDDNEYRYIGAIQTVKGGYYPLNDQSLEIFEEGIDDEELNAEQWLGALYYNMFESKHKSEKYYLLLGFNGYQFFNKKKIIDVLHFDDDGQPYFGKEVFLPDSASRQNGFMRQIYTYSADVSLKLNYDPVEGMIVLDHLIPIKEIYPGQGPTAVPDGSYEGFKYRNGKWQHVSVLEQKALDNIEVMPKDPTKKDLDLFGRPKK